MRIVIDGRMLNWTGIGRYTERLLRELPATGSSHDYAVVLHEGSPARERLRAAGYHVVTSSAAPYGVGEQAGLYWSLRKLRPDLVHFTHFASPVAYQKPFVVTIHDLTLVNHRTRRNETAGARLANELKRMAMMGVLHHAVRRSRRILAPSWSTANAIHRYFGRDLEAISVTYEAADLLAEQPADIPGVTVARPTLLYVGNNYPFKNVALIPAAMTVLAAQHPDLQLVLAGQSDVFRGRLLASLPSSTRHRVIDVGRVSDAQLAWLYRHATTLVYPSLSEGFGLPGLEAMAHGLPVLASNAPCLPEILGDAAVYFDPTSADSLAAAIAGLLTSPPSRTALAERGLAHAQAFSWQRMAEQTVACYEAALDGHPNHLPSMQQPEV